YKIKVDYAGLYSDYSNQVLNAKVSDKNGKNIAFATIASAKNGTSGTTYFSFDAPTNNISDYVVEIYVANNGVMASSGIYQKDADGTIGAQGTIWLDPVLGNDNNTGLLEAYPIKTIEQAMAIAGKNATIILKNTIVIDKDTTIDFGGKNVTIKRWYDSEDDYFKGNMFEVGVWDDTKTAEENAANRVTLTLGSVTINGGGYIRDSISRGIYVKNANIICNGTIIQSHENVINGPTFYLVKNSTITFNGGKYFYNGTYSSKGGVVYATEGSSIIVNDGRFVDNTGYEGGVFYLKDSSLEIYRGYFDNTGNAGSGSFEIVNATKVYIANSTFENHTNAGSEPYAGVMGIFECKNIDVTILNCKFLNNQTKGKGGVFYLNNNTNTTLKIYDCEFIGNKSTAGDGGVIYAKTAIDLEIYNTLFEGNEATTSPYAGGAIWAAGGEHSFYNCEFINNKAYNSGAVVLNEAVGVSIIDCTFEGNKGNSGGSLGGALRIIGADINNTYLKIDNSEFKTNNAGTGGAISFNKGYAEITNCEFSGNTSGQTGGAIGFGTNIIRVRIENCEFNECKASDVGGAIYSPAVKLSVYNSKFVKNTSGGNATGGAAILANSSSTTVCIEGCDFSENISKGNGGAVCTSATGTNTINNCNFINNQAGYSSGGAIYCNKTLFVDGGLFKGNSAPRTGGAISGVYTIDTWDNPEGFHTESNYFYTGGDKPQATIKNAIFEGNYVTDTRVSAGGAICLSGNSKPDSIDNC
ncbi:MAG: hypothetical protein IJW25_03330, partial [Clostridia bacterium]|nr:hypothetical protein [Clostridia bacterium]